MGSDRNPCRPIHHLLIYAVTNFNQFLGLFTWSIPIFQIWMSYPYWHQFSKKYWCTNTDTNYSDYGSNPYSLPLHTHLQFQSLSATSIHFHRPSSTIKTTSSKLFLVCKIKYQKNIWVQRNFIPIKSLGQRKFGMQKSFWWEKFRP